MIEYEESKYVTKNISEESRLFGFYSKKVDDLMCTTEVILRRGKTVVMDKEAFNFILLVILLGKMMRVAKMCY